MRRVGENGFVRLRQSRRPVRIRVTTGENWRSREDECRLLFPPFVHGQGREGEHRMEPAPASLEEEYDREHKMPMALAKSEDLHGRGH
jgi:hypothetical protein